MNRINYLILFAFYFFCACKAQPNKTTKGIDFKSHKIVTTISGKSNCNVEINIHYLNVMGNDINTKSICASINDTIWTRVRQHAFSCAMNTEVKIPNSTPSTIESDLKPVIQKEFDTYLLDNNVTDEYFMPYNCSVFDTMVGYKPSSRLVSILNEGYDYYGGAHGEPYNFYWFFDTKTGKELDITNLVADTTMLKKLAERAFIEHITEQKWNEVSPEKWDEIIQQYFVSWSNVKGFEMPHIIGFDNNNLVLYYGVYEIDSYAAGSTEIKIPIKDLKGILNKAYFP